MTACPETVKAGYTKENDVFAESTVKYVNPVLNLQVRKLLAHQMFTAFQPLLGLSAEENQRAIEAGYKALGVRKLWHARDESEAPSTLPQRA